MLQQHISNFEALSARLNVLIENDASDRDVFNVDQQVEACFAEIAEYPAKSAEDALALLNFHVGKIEAVDDIVLAGNHVTELVAFIKSDRFRNLFSSEAVKQDSDISDEFASNKEPKAKSQR